MVLITKRNKNEISIHRGSGGIRRPNWDFKENYSLCHSSLKSNFLYPDCHLVSRNFICLLSLRTRPRHVKREIRLKFACSVCRYSRTGLTQAAYRLILLLLLLLLLLFLLLFLLSSSSSSSSPTLLLLLLLLLLTFYACYRL